MHLPQPDLAQLYRACNPTKILNIDDPIDRKYYIDFSQIRGSEILRELGKHIQFMTPASTCQLFTGHIGCGKSTELLRLKANLQKQGFHVVYFESDQYMDRGDTDISDILLAIARQVSESLDAINIPTQSGYFANLLQECASFLQTPINVEMEGELSLGIAKITAKTKENPGARSQLRQYLEDKTDNLLKAINDDLLKPAIQKLKNQGATGLVIIIDDLDKIDDRLLAGRKDTLPEYLFVCRGEQLRNLTCHVIYTIPMSLMFSNKREALRNGMGGGGNPMVLPMVPVRFKDGSPCMEGLLALQQMVLARAFPEYSSDDRLQYIDTIFDRSETLDRLCQVSGGHVRNLLGLMCDCLKKIDTLPISSECLEKAIREERQYLTRTIDPGEWQLLRQVNKTQRVTGEQGYQTLLKSMFVFEYRTDVDGCWFEVNPILADAPELQAE